MFKETEDPPFEEYQVWFTTGPFKPLSNQEWMKGTEYLSQTQMF